MGDSDDVDFFKHDDVFSNWEKKGSQYPSWQEILGELIQNSVKELEHCAENLVGESPEYEPRIDITFDSNEKTVTICDNGRGMPGLFAFGLGNSPVRENNNGQISGSGFGIGLNAVIVQSDYMSVKTVFHEETPEKVSVITMTGWREQLAKIVNNTSMKPKQKKSSLLERTKRKDQVNDDLHVGTVVDFQSDSVLSDLWESLDEGGLENVHSELLCRTAIGYTNNLWDSVDLSTPDIKYSFTHIPKSGQREIIGPNNIGFAAHLPYHNSSKEFLVSTHSKKKDVNTEEDDSIPSKDQIMRIDKIVGKDGNSGLRMDIYAMCTVGTKKGTSGKDGQEYFREYFGGYLNEKGGPIMISVKGFPQSFTVPKHKKSSQTGGIPENTWVMINVHDNIIEEGRNKVQPGYEIILQEAALAVYREFRKKAQKGAKKQTSRKLTEKQIKQLITNAEKNPLPTYPENRKKKETVLMVAPDRESMVVASFVELVATKQISGIRFYNVGDNTKTYDFIVRPDYLIKQMGDDAIDNMKKHYDEVSEEDLVSEHEAWHTYEAKLHVSDFMDEWVNKITGKKSSKKVFDQIDFLVAWNRGNLTKAHQKHLRYREIPSEEKRHPNATHIIELAQNPEETVQVFQLENFYTEDRISRN